MELTINGKKITLNFGVKFVRNLDKAYGMSNVSGMSLGMGLVKAVSNLEVFDPSALSEVIQSASDKPITIDEVDDYIDNCKDLEKLFTEVKNEMDASNPVNFAKSKLMSANIQKAIKTPKK